MTTVSTVCNGWTNRETWLVSLWLGSEPATQSMLERFAEIQGTVCYRSEQLREEIEGHLRDSYTETSIWSDLLHSSLSQVDWQQIIESSI